MYKIIKKIEIVRYFINVNNKIKINKINRLNI
jgi:hypothetical protein